MSKVTNAQREKLLEAAKKIHEHKLLQVKGYKTLIQRASDERIKQLLNQISNDEEKHAEFPLPFLLDIENKHLIPRKTICLEESLSPIPNFRQRTSHTGQLECPLQKHRARPK